MNVPQRKKVGGLIQVACLILIFGLAWISPVEAATFTGRAFSALINVPTLGAGPVYISDTNELTGNGGWQGVALADTQVPTAFSADVLVAATSGGKYHAQGNRADSSTSLANVIVLPGSLAQVTASFVRAETGVSSAGVRGFTEVHELIFGGVPVTVTGQPNQTVVMPGVATLIINEQSAGLDAITVNALHLILASGGEVIVSSAKSSIF